MPTASRAPSRPGAGRRIGPAAVALAALVGFASGDACEPPGKQILNAGAIGAINVYRATVSPLLSRTGIVRCRFQPTCSSYAREALSRYGLPRGLLLSAGRVARCQPFAKGGLDPVP